MSFDKRNMNLITEELESLSPKNGKFLSNFSFFLKNGLDFLLVKNERHVKRLQHSETYLKHENYAYSYELKIKIHYIFISTVTGTNRGGFMNMFDFLTLLRIVGGLKRIPSFFSSSATLGALSYFRYNSAILTIKSSFSFNVNFLHLHWCERCGFFLKGTLLFFPT
jgi:hypothetical protein